jgi:hypothetical protein
LSLQLRNESYPVPVLFHLSSWSSKRQKLDLWLREELRTKYQIPSQLAQFWVSNRQILPLLDGLDEVPTRYRSKCVEIINDFRLESGSFPMVICCREDDYFAQGERLLLERALTMQPLTKEQVDIALSKAGVKREELRTAFQNESELYELAAKPLFLKVLMHICQEGGTGDLVFTGSFETERKDLFSLYVHHMLRSQRRQQAQKKYDPEMAISWLSWLAETHEMRNEVA